MKIARLKLDNFNGGISADFAKTGRSSFPTQSGTYYLGLLNTMRPTYQGQVNGAAGVNVSQSSVSLKLMVNAKTANNGYAWGINSVGNIQYFDPSSVGASITSYTAPAGASDDIYKDIAIHVDNTGTETVFYTYDSFLGKGTTANFVGTRNDTFYSFNFLDVLHAMAVSVNNRLYITDGNYLRYYDPATGTMNSGINVGVGYTLTSVADYGDYVAAVGSNGKQARMWLWDGASEFPNFQYEIRDVNCTAIVNEGGSLRVFTYGKSGTTKIKTFISAGFTEESDWEVPTSTCVSPLHGMVDIYINQIVWRDLDGYLWSFGSPRKNYIQSGAHRWGKIEQDAQAYGMVKNLYQDVLHIGSAYNSSYWVHRMKADDGYQFQTGNSNLTTNLYQLPHRSTIKKIAVRFSNCELPGPSFAGDTFNMSFYKGYDDTTDYLNYSLPTAGDNSTTIEWLPIEKSIPNVDFFFLDIDFKGCVIKEITVEYTYDENEL